MSLKEGALYKCEKTGAVIMVVKSGEGANTLGTDHGQMVLHQAGVSDAELASAAAGVRVKPGVIVRHEVRVAHELADTSFPVTGVTARVEWEKNEDQDKKK